MLEASTAQEIGVTPSASVLSQADDIIGQLGDSYSRRRRKLESNMEASMSARLEAGLSEPPDTRQERAEPLFNCLKALKLWVCERLSNTIAAPGLRSHDAQLRCGDPAVWWSEKVRRREFILSLAATAIDTLPSRASADAKFRIGFLGLAPASGWTGPVQAFRTRLNELGYEEGRNLSIDFKWADGVADLQQAANQFVTDKVDVIVAPASTEVVPAARATQSIPIVFAQHADPVGLGHADSLARPGHNITGVSMLLTELTEKGLDLMVEALPSSKRFGVIWNPTTPSHPRVLSVLTNRAHAIGVELFPVPVKALDEFDGAFSQLVDDRVGGFIVPTSPLTNANPVPIAEGALRQGLPGFFGNRENATAGGLMSYGADFNYMYAHCADYIDKILKGMSPSELPIEQATKYYLVINLVTADKLRLQIPRLIVARADEIIG